MNNFNGIKKDDIDDEIIVSSQNEELCLDSSLSTCQKNSKNVNLYYKKRKTLENKNNYIYNEFKEKINENGIEYTENTKEYQKLNFMKGKMTGNFILNDDNNYKFKKNVYSNQKIENKKSKIISCCRFYCECDVKDQCYYYKDQNFSKNKHTKVNYINEKALKFEDYSDKKYMKENDTFFYKKNTDEKFYNNQKSKINFKQKKIKLSSDDVFPDQINIGYYYFLRQRKNLNMIIVKVLQLFGSKYIVKNEYGEEIIASKNELLLFNPNNRLFETLMKLPSYRNDPYIKKILMNLKYEKIEKYNKVIEIKNLFDHDIKAQEFYDLYADYYFNEFKLDKNSGIDNENIVFYLHNSKDRNLINEIKTIIVTGTFDMSLHELYIIVCKNGGMEQVTNDQKWKHLFYKSMSKTNVSYTIRTFYKKYLYEFEILRRQNNSLMKTKNNFLFSVNDKIYFNVEKETYFGTVKLQRNRGLNQYYIQFYGWSKEYNEWYSEDVINKFYDNFSSIHKMKRKTRSSKANNLIDDPLTREKHCHFTSINTKIVVDENNYLKTDKICDQIEIKKIPPFIELMEESNNKYTPMNRLALRYLGSSEKKEKTYIRPTFLSKDYETNTDTLKTALENKCETNYDYKTDQKINQIIGLKTMKKVKVNFIGNKQPVKKYLWDRTNMNKLFNTNKNTWKMLDKELISLHVNERNYSFKTFFNLK